MNEERLVFRPRPREVRVVRRPCLSGQALCERICHGVRPCALDQHHDAVLYKVSDLVTPHIDVTCEFPVDGVLCDLYAGRVIFPDFRSGCLLNAEAPQDRSKVHHLLSRHGCSDIFSFS
eukprot:3935052-Rhodomonas_salina.1